MEAGSVNLWKETRISGSGFNLNEGEKEVSLIHLKVYFLCL
jgi:hypothetical protein